MKLTTPRLATVAAALTFAFLPVSVSTAATGGSTSRPSPASDCLWVHTFTADDTDDNYAFPDSGAHYWAAAFTVPDGAKLDLVGTFAHARYQSLNSYDLRTNAPVDALNDVSTKPDPGSRNPYRPGALRIGDVKRAYTVHVSTDRVPGSGRVDNTLYSGVADQSSQLVLYRLYLPDRGRDITGGAGLPQPRLTLPGGQVLTGSQACDALKASTDKPYVATLPLSTYLSLRDQPGKPATFPAKADPRWLSFYNVQFGIQCTYFDMCGGAPALVQSQYANIDNKYVSAQASRGFGSVLTLRGKLPVTPATLDRQPVMARKVDMRYWSLCSNESMATTRVEACVDDEDVVTDSHGYYTIVVSRPEDRPSEATERCGVTWLAWPERGDGAGHLDDNFLILRNMLPSAQFRHAVQNTRVPGDEREVMAEYLPTSTYGDAEDFTAPRTGRACRA